ncbi:MAG: dihydrofolate reductase [Muribaculaceae bacterium]|nr:dihydrofolate reductase [Muribaculaceae bacterium]
MKPEVIIIVAATRDLAIGKEGDLLYHISADLKRFKSLTMGETVVMGRKTFESLPGGPLPGRENIVVTRNPKYRPAGVKTAPSLDEAVAMTLSEKCFIIGGGELYRAALPLAVRIELTSIDTMRPDADTFLDADIKDGRWSVEEESETFTDPRSGIDYRFVTLVST